MRNVSFALTTQQFLARTKTVTRRLGWLWARPGLLLCGCEKVMGRRPGEPLRRLGIIVIVGVRREPLDAIDQADVHREGFDMTPAEFVVMFNSHMGGTPEIPVSRVEYRYIPGGMQEPQ